METKSYDEKTKNNAKNVMCETKSFYILLAFLLFSITLLIAFMIYFYLIKYKERKKHLLAYYVINNKFINVL